MDNYLAVMKKILTTGETRVDRTGVGTKSLFGVSLDFDLTKGFPIITTKKVNFKAVVAELLWFLEGSTQERRLCEILYGTRDKNKKTIWTENANDPKWVGSKVPYSNGYTGKIYGYQWRYGMGDQIKKLIEGIKENPNSRRHILSSWNPNDLDSMCLPPCHILAQFYVTNNRELQCLMYQRSADWFLGVPFNISSYALLTHIVALHTGLAPNKLLMNFGDAHIYNNHIDQCCEQYNRIPKTLPILNMPTSPKTLYGDDPRKNIYGIVCCDYVVDDFLLDGYNPHPVIKGDMAL